MKFKKIFSFILVFVLLFSNLSLSSFGADTSDMSVNDFSVELESFLAENAQYSTTLPSVDDSSTETSEQISTNRLIVSTNSNKALINDSGAVSKLEGFNNWHILQYDSEDACAAAFDYYSCLESVNYVEVDKVLDVEELEFDDSYEFNIDDWGKEIVESSEAMALLDSCNINQETITVAVIDTGVDETHTLFNKDSVNSRILEGNREMDNTVDSSYEKYYHGTHVAGIIVNNTSSNVKVKSYNYFYYRGKQIEGTTITLATEIKLAVSDNVDVINLSLGGLGSTYKALADELDKAISAGIIVVTSAGNKNKNAADYYPANYSKLITVAATNFLNLPSSFSNYGSVVDIAAPGSLINSSTPNGKYKKLSGTSMAAPFVSAAAAMIKSVNPDITPTEIEELIKSTAFVPEGWDANYGVGIVNFMNILEKMRSEQPTIKLTGDGNMSITSSAANTEIYYTLDGTDPVYGKSTLYTEPFNVWNTDTVKTIAFTASMLPSEIRIFNMITKKDIELEYKDNTVLMIAPDIKHAYSTDKDIVTVDVEGNVYAVSPGEAQLIIRLNNGKRYIYNVTVEIPRWRIISLIFFKLFNILLY